MKTDALEANLDAPSSPIDLIMNECSLNSF